MKKQTKKVETPQQMMHPMGDRVIVVPLSLEESGTLLASGIVIPDMVAKEKPTQGTVIAVGPGKMSPAGKFIPMPVKIGDRVLYSQFGYDEVKVGNRQYYILNADSILAVITH